MIRIYDNSKALGSILAANDNGVGVVETVDGFVDEELNGIYEAEFKVATSEKYFDLLEVNRVIGIDTSEGLQLFRVYYISVPINNIATVRAQHITYDMLKIAVEPFTATGISATLQGLANNVMGGTYPFTFTTDISNASSSFSLDIPRSQRECLGGYQGSILDVFACEYKWDNLNIEVLTRRGSDQGVTISYGKNLTNYTKDETIESTYTAVLGYAVVNEQAYYGTVQTKVASTYPRVKIVDFSENFDEDDVPTSAQLDALAANYAANNDIESSHINLTINFVPLWQTNEYKDIAVLDDVYLGDTVYVRYKGDTVSSRVISTRWNINYQRYEQIELGSPKSNLASIISDSVEESTNNTASAIGFLQSELNDMASLIINGLGLHRTLVKKENGGYTIYLHNKETLATSDTWYVMSANGILVSTDYGQTWNAGFDSQGNAVLNSLATITLRALEIYGSRITFGDENDKYITAGVYVDGNNDPVGVSFDGTGYARFQPHEQFEVVNLDSNDRTLNSFVLAPNSDSSGGAQIQATNYKSNYAKANSFSMIAERNGNAETMIQLQNMQYNSTSFANNISMMSNATNQAILMQNRIAGSSYIDNAIQMRAYPSYSETSIANRYKTTGNDACKIIVTNNDSASSITLTAYNTSGSAVSVLMLSSSGIYINGYTPFTSVSATSGSVSCGANATGSTTVSITIPSGYKGAAVANIKSNGGVVPAYTTAAVFGMTGTNTLTIWWQNGTNSAVTCTFTIELLCVVNV